MSNCKQCNELINYAQPNGFVHQCVFCEHFWAWAGEKTDWFKKNKPSNFICHNCREAPKDFEPIISVEELLPKPKPKVEKFRLKGAL